MWNFGLFVFILVFDHIGASYDYASEPGSCFATKDFLGNDLTSFEGISSPEACQIECQNYPGCNYWSLITNLELAGYCFVKSAVTVINDFGYAGQTVISGTQFCGPDGWFGQCNTGSLQSPIDIPYNYDHLKRRDDWLPFQWLHYNVEPHKMYIENDGHTAIVTFEANDCHHLPTVIQGNLPGSFQLAEIRFHWGHYGNEGSEHTLFGNQFDAEMQLIHFNTKCGNTLEEARNNCQTEALANFAVLIKESGGDNKAFNSIIEGLEYIKYQGQKTYIKPMVLKNLLPKDVDEFFRYYGSETYPECLENVIWTLFKNPIKLSRSQLKRFFKLDTIEANYVNKTLKNNFRPIQPLNDRPIYYADLKLDCDHDHDWKFRQGCEIYYKETKEKSNFIKSVHSCLGNHYSKTPHQGLIPVGKLRCLRNRFTYNEYTDRPNTDEFCGRFFRVNAIKDIQGVWREHPSGKRVSFHHFPEFDEKHGGFGDTLIWDAFLNHLFIQSEYEEYPGLCYRFYQNDCEHCDGFETGHMCSDSGDCYENQCWCDDMFSGTSCQLGPVPDKEIIIVGGSTDSIPSSAYNTLNDLTCDIASYNQATDTSYGQVCDYVFGRGICCSGLVIDNMQPSDSCMFYDCFTKSWIPIADIPRRLIDHRSNVIRQKGRDWRWLIAGGLEGLSFELQSKNMFWLYEDEHIGTERVHWDYLSDQLPESRSKHCQVQINDCEVAFIGGERGDLNNDVIDIWNFKERTWRTKTLYSSVNYPACGILKDRTNQHRTVVIGCGRDSTVVQYWDLETNQIHLSAFQCPDVLTASDEDGHFDELNDNYLIFTNSQEYVYRFDLENGFVYTGTTSVSHHGGDSFVAPRGTVECTSGSVLPVLPPTIN